MYIMVYEVDSDGNMISMLEAFLGEKERKRTFWEKYFLCKLKKKNFY